MEAVFAFGVTNAEFDENFTSIPQTGNAPPKGALAPFRATGLRIWLGASYFYDTRSEGEVQVNAEEKLSPL